MAKDEVVVLKEDEFSRLVRKPLYVGSGAERKKAKDIEVTEMKLGLSAEKVATWIARQDPAWVIACFNRGSDLGVRQANAVERPGVVSYTVKLKGVETDIRTMDVARFAALFNYTVQGVAIGKVKAIPEGFKLHASELVKQGKASHKGENLVAK